MSIERIFFELLQIAIGNRKSLSRVPTAAEWGELYNMATRQALTGVCFVGLQRLSNDNTSHSTSSGQAVSSAQAHNATANLPELFRLKWLGIAAKIQQRNQMMNEECVAVTKQLAHDGLACCILKGQGNIPGYGLWIRDDGLESEPLGMYRTPGDIDVWCWPQEDSRSTSSGQAVSSPTECGIEIAVSDLDGKGAHYEHYSGARGVIEYALMQARVAGNPAPEVRYNHVELPNVWKADVEIHHRPVFFCSPVRNCRLQRWLRDNEQFGLHDAKIGDCVIPTPTVSFNAVYQLTHIYRHLFDEGVGLRQLLDYYFVLRALHIEQGSLADRTQNMVSTSSPQVQQWAEGSCQREENLRAGSQVIPSAAEARQSLGMGMSVRSNAEILHTLSSFGMKRFASAVMYVLAKVFANDDDDDNDNFHSDGVHKPSTINHKPWMICEPDEKEGKFLLNEIMQAGNFGKYDDRIKHGGTQFSHAIEKTKHNIRLLTHYPEEVLWEPVFRVYHWVWRRFELWRY